MSPWRFSSWHQGPRRNEQAHKGVAGWAFEVRVDQDGNGQVAEFISDRKDAVKHPAEWGTKVDRPLSCSVLVDRSHALGNQTPVEETGHGRASFTRPSAETGDQFGAIAMNKGARESSLNSRKPETPTRSAQVASIGLLLLGAQAQQRSSGALRSKWVAVVIRPPSRRAFRLGRPAAGAPDRCGPLVEFLCGRKTGVSRFLRARWGAAWVGGPWLVAQRGRGIGHARRRSGWCWNHCCSPSARQAVHWLQPGWVAAEGRRPPAGAPPDGLGRGPAAFDPASGSFPAAV